MAEASTEAPLLDQPKNAATIKYPEMTSEEEADGHTRSDASKSFMGHQYHMYVGMQILWRAYCEEDFKFKMAVEMKSETKGKENKFDDIVIFTKKQDECQHIYMQVKHLDTLNDKARHDEKKISFDLLLDIGFYKMIKSYNAVKDESKAHFVLVTNRDIDYNQENHPLGEYFQKIDCPFDKVVMDKDVFKIKEEKIQCFLEQLLQKCVEKKGKKTKDLTQMLNEVIKKIRSKEEEEKEELIQFLSKFYIAANHKSLRTLENLIRTEMNKKFEQNADARFCQFNTQFWTWLSKVDQSYFMDHDKIKDWFNFMEKPVFDFGIENQELISVFYGRNDELKILATMATTSEGSMMVIKGESGVGKSEMVREFLLRSDHYIDKIWIDGRDSNTLLRSYSNLAGKLGIFESTEDKMIRKIYKELQYRKCFIIVDGLVNYSDIVKYLPEVGNGKNELGPIAFIITCQDLEETTEWDSIAEKWMKHGGDKKWKKIQLKRFSSSEYPKILRENADKLKDLEDFKLNDIALPFVSQLVASYIREKGTNIISFISDLIKLKAPFELDKVDENIIKIFERITLTMKETEDGKLALKVLSLLAFLGGNEVPEELFSIPSFEEKNLKSAFSVLRKYSLLRERSGTKKILTLHHNTIKLMTEHKCREGDNDFLCKDQIADIIKEMFKTHIATMENNYGNFLPEVLNIALHVWEEHIVDDTYFSYFPGFKALILEDLSFSQNTVQADDFTEMVKEFAEREPKKVVTNCWNYRTEFSRHLYYACKYDECIKKSLEVANEILVFNKIDRIGLKEGKLDNNDFPKIQRACNKWEGSHITGKIFSKALIIFGYVSHNNTKTMDDEMAEKLYNIIVPATAKFYTEKDRLYLLALNGRSRVYMNKNTEKSLKCAQEDVEKILNTQREKNLNEYNIEMIASKKLLARVYQKMRNFYKARELLKDVMNKMVESSGSDNVRTLYTRGRYATLMTEWDRPEKAIKYLEDIIPIIVKKLETDTHIEVFVNKYRLVVAFATSKRMEDANEIARKLRPQIVDANENGKYNDLLKKLDAVAPEVCLESL